MILKEWLLLFIARFWISTEVYWQHYSACYMAGATWNCCRLGARSVCTIQPCTRLQCSFIRRYTFRVHVCLAVICHLYFWQNDRHLLHATVVTRGWNGYQNKRQHRELTLRRNLSCRDSNPEPFYHKSGCHWAKSVSNSNNCIGLWFHFIADGLTTKQRPWKLH